MLNKLLHVALLALINANLVSVIHAMADIDQSSSALKERNGSPHRNTSSSAEHSPRALSSSRLSSSSTLHTSETTNTQPNPDLKRRSHEQSRLDQSATGGHPVHLNTFQPNISYNDLTADLDEDDTLQENEEPDNNENTDPEQLRNPFYSPKEKNQHKKRPQQSALLARALSTLLAVDTNAQEQQQTPNTQGYELRTEPCINASDTAESTSSSSSVHTLTESDEGEALGEALDDYSVQNTASQSTSSQASSRIPTSGTTTPQHQTRPLDHYYQLLSEAQAALTPPQQFEMPIPPFTPNNDKIREAEQKRALERYAHHSCSIPTLQITEPPLLNSQCPTSNNQTANTNILNSTQSQILSDHSMGVTSTSTNIPSSLTVHQPVDVLMPEPNASSEIIGSGLLVNGPAQQTLSAQTLSTLPVSLHTLPDSQASRTIERSTHTVLLSTATHGNVIAIKEPLENQNYGQLYNKQTNIYQSHDTHKDKKANSPNGEKTTSLLTGKKLFVGSLLCLLGYTLYKKYGTKKAERIIIQPIP